MSSTVTIEFERMPNVDKPVMLTFQRIVRETYCTYECGTVIFREWAICHPSDTFSWEVGMRLAAKRACSPEAYRAFRRWMWLEKAAHECDRPKWNCNDCAVKSACDPIERGLDHEPIDIIIAREFGRVKVRVT